MRGSDSPRFSEIFCKKPGPCADEATGRLSALTPTSMEIIMKKQTLASLAIGSAFAAVALTPIAHAADNPFAAKQLSAGYQLVV